MKELDYIVNQWNLNIDQPSPIEVPERSRVSLAYMFGELGYRVGAEIGTARGDYAYSLCLGNRKAKLYCIDAWEVYADYGDYTDQGVLHDCYQTAMKRLKPYGSVEFIRKYSMDALGLFDDKSLDYVYIDANHEWPYVTQDIYHWALKVRPGGIVAGHDYSRSRRCHVGPVVDGYTNTFRIKPWFILGETEIKGCNRTQSWFWVKK